jgi:hypothetical protein
MVLVTLHSQRFLKIGICDLFVSKLGLETGAHRCYNSWKQCFTDHRHHWHWQYIYSYIYSYIYIVIYIYSWMKHQSWMSQCQLCIGKPSESLKYNWQVTVPPWVFILMVSCGFVWKCCVPLNPMVLLIIIPIKWLFHWEYTLFSDKPM